MIKPIATFHNTPGATLEFCTRPGCNTGFYAPKGAKKIRCPKCDQVQRPKFKPTLDNSKKGATVRV